MKLLIDISKETYIHLRNGGNIGASLLIENAIKNGTPIPDNATNGDVIKAMFDVKEIDMSNTYCVHFPEEEEYGHYFFKGWWNAPYQKK